MLKEIIERRRQIKAENTGLHGKNRTVGLEKLCPHDEQAVRKPHSTTQRGKVETEEVKIFGGLEPSEERKTVSGTGGQPHLKGQGSGKSDQGVDAIKEIARGPIDFNRGVTKQKKG